MDSAIVDIVSILKAGGAQRAAAVAWTGPAGVYWAPPVGARGSMGPAQPHLNPNTVGPDRPGEPTKPVFEPNVRYRTDFDHYTARCGNPGGVAALPPMT